MALQFQPPFQINPNTESHGERSLSRLGDTFNDIGNTAMKYRQQQIENQRQQAILKLQQAQGARQGQEQVYNYGSDAGGWTPPPDEGASPGGSLQQGTTGPQPNYSMDSGESGYVPPGGSSPMPVDHTSHFMNWKGMGMPSSYDHPDYGGTGQAMGMRPNPMAQAPQQPSGPNPNDPYGIGVDVSRVGHKGYDFALGPARSQAGARVLGASPLSKSIFGNANPQDIAMSGVNAGEMLPKIAELEAANKWKAASFGNKVDEFDRNEGNKIGTELNSLTASGRTAVGQAAGIQRRVASAQSILSRPDSTPQELSAAVNDIGTILAGGQSYESLNREQGYNTAATKWANMKTYLTSQPQAVNTPEIKQRILGILSDLSKVSDNVIAKNTRTVQAAHARWIQKNPDQWRDLVTSIQPDQGGATTPPPAGGGAGAPQGGGWKYVGKVGG